MARSYESNGPDVKIRGTALHIAEKYLQLARDAQSSGDRVGAESYLQHAEHYFRIVTAAQAQMPQAQTQARTEGDDSNDEEDRSTTDGGERGAGPQPFVQPAFGLADPQPYVNGNGQSRAEGDESGNGEQRESREQGSGNRGRRRRPYRERANPDQAEAAGADTKERSEAAGAASED